MLKSVKVGRFKSCVGCELELNQSLTALIGPNGVGKTNLLTAIYWAASSSISSEPFATAHFPANEELPIKIEFTLERGDHEYKYSLSYGMESQSEKYQKIIAETISFFQNDKWTLVVRREKGSVEMFIDGIQSEPLEIGFSSPCISSLMTILPETNSVRRHVTHVFHEFRAVRYYPLNTEKTEFDVMTSETYSGWLSDPDAASLSYYEETLLKLLRLHESEDEQFEEIKALLGPNGLNLIEHIVIHEHSPGDTNASTGKKAQKKFYFIFFYPTECLGGHGEPFNFWELSAGTQRAIALLVSIIVDGNGTMLIEQPEDTIHRGLLRRLVDLLRVYANNSQIIFSTHSAAVLDCLSPNELALVSADKGVTQLRQLSEKDLEAARKYLEHVGTLSDYLESLE